MNHLMKIMHAGQMQMRMVTVSEWIARVEACSPTSNVRICMDKCKADSQSLSWKFGKLFSTIELQTFNF
jgi:hypothetical protein